jgi:hypothetical protein
LEKKTKFLPMAVALLKHLTVWQNPCHRPSQLTDCTRHARRTTASLKIAHFLQMIQIAKRAVFGA